MYKKWVLFLFLGFAIQSYSLSEITSFSHDLECADCLEECEGEKEEKEPSDEHVHMFANSPSDVVLKLQSVGYIYPLPTKRPFYDVPHQPPK